MTAAEPKTLHIWMPDQRSLCDRRAHPALPTNDPDKEAMATAEAKAAPACSACILIAGRIRYQACELLLSRDCLYPETPTEAWKSMGGTRWDLVVDIEGHLKTPDLDRLTKFDAIKFAINEQMVLDQLPQT